MSHSVLVSCHRFRACQVWCISCLSLVCPKEDNFRLKQRNFLFLFVKILIYFKDINVNLHVSIVNLYLYGQVRENKIKIKYENLINIFSILRLKIILIQINSVFLLFQNNYIQFRSHFKCKHNHNTFPRHLMEIFF